MRSRKNNRWTTSDMNTIINNLNLTDKELGAILNRSELMVRQFRRRNGIVKGSHANQRGNPNGNIQNLKPRGGFKADRIAA